VKLFPLNLAVQGVGVVSAAGWGLKPFMDALVSQDIAPPSTLERIGGEQRQWPCAVRVVPPVPADYLPRSPRLRRASPLTKFLLGAAVEALGEFKGTLGIIQVMQNGAVQYSGRFYHELQTTPTMPSPLIFPETVFNAPTSHVASCLGINGMVTTLIGEGNLLLEALLTARQWLDEALVERVLVLAGEETDWLSAEASTYYHRDANTTEGAVALLLSDAQKCLPQLMSTSGLISHSPKVRSRVLAELASTSIHQHTSPERWVSAATGLSGLDSAEHEAWAGYGLSELAPARVMGMGLGVGTGFQVAAALSWSTAGQESIVSCPGLSSSGVLRVRGA
jgi:3-oxoacyl-[acyl-carrier-protein] synthase II